MEKIKKYIFSMSVTVTLLAIFAISIGYATFLENSDGTEYAKQVIYNAKWFELLLALLIVSLIGSIFKYKLASKKKWSVLLFHSAFILILIGSSITRYFSYEGMMHIRQGETTNLISTEQTSVKIVAKYNGQQTERKVEVNFSPTSSNELSEQLEVGGKTISIENKLFIPNAIESIEQSETGEPVVGIFIMSGANQSMDIVLFGDEKKSTGDVSFAFEGKKDSADVLFSMQNDELFFKANSDFSKTGTMASGMIDRQNAITIKAGEYCAAENNIVYRLGKLVFMIKGYYPKATKTLTVQTENNGMASNALVMEVKEGSNTEQLNVFSSEDENPQAANCVINDVDVSIYYGKLKREIPFSLTLNLFDLERYQGSMSPSSYASEVTITDNDNKTVFPFRIYMNNILDYRGYRFFQSSYDNDEMGTVLSVNHDYWGTLVTYIGYFLMFLGMIMTLFNKNSRFSTLIKLTNQIQEKRKNSALLILLVSSLLFGGNLSAQSNINKEAHIEQLNSLLVQDAAQGRIEPLCTYTSDVLRKIYKHNSYKEKSATEVILGMSVNPSLWKNEPMIKVANPDLEKELGAIQGYISFNQAFSNGLNYKLSEQVEKAYQKEESGRNKYEKELINVDERINICNMIYSHDLLAIFPNLNDANGKWEISKLASTTSSNAACPYCEEKGITGEMPSSMAEMPKGMSMDDMMAGSANKSDQVNPHAAMGECTRDKTSETKIGAIKQVAKDSPEMLYSDYLSSVDEAFSSGNWSTANTNLAKIKAYQTKFGGTNLPTEGKIRFEISYNNWNIFNNLMIAYGIVGFILLMLHFLYIFKPNASLEKVLRFGIFPLGLLFLTYTSGMIMRWYISGHAPWSNGYESMLFVGWASSLSGFLFARKSPLAFSVTALLSAIALSVAAMSWMNPEITNLVPVLKSYWLIVHVAIITSSYGFLAMGAILGLLNLVLIAARTEKNSARLLSNIQEISYIIEMALIVGLFMLTIGTFIGGVWANESWGRYWGWDAKETWALVSVLVYAIILHLRLIPKLNKAIVLSTMSIIGFFSVIMTFLGVNYYLSGMHSYGKGTPPPIPTILYFFIIAIVIIVFMAINKEKSLSKK